MSELSGITYYSLESPYSGDTTKNCGLTAKEIDDNFFFLRGNEIIDFSWDDEEHKFILTKLNGKVIETDAVDAYISQSVEIIVSSLTESIDQIKCDLSGMAESIEGIYEQIDQKFAEFESGLTEYKQIIEFEMDRREEELITLFNSGLTRVSELLQTVMETASHNSELIESLSSSTSNAISTLRQEIENQDLELNQKIQQTKSDLQRQITGVDDRLSSAITDNSCRIDDIENTLENMSGGMSGQTELIESLSSSTSNAISTLRQEIENLDSTIEEHSLIINNLSSGTDNKFVAIQNEMNAMNDNLVQKIDNVKTDTDNTITTLATNVANEFDSVENNIDSLNNDVENLKIVVSGITGDMPDIPELSGGTIIQYITYVVSSTTESIENQLTFTGDDVEE